MNKYASYMIGCLGATVLSGAGMGSALAGGLVDTSPDAFQKADFVTEPSANITNPWWTLPEGSNFLYFAETEDGCEWNLVEILEATTSAFKGIYNGTDARIVLDRAWVDEECEYEEFADVYGNIDPEETTYDWYAQDTDENIWYMGEDTWDGESKEGSFVAGCDGAEAGIVILGKPFKGARYKQEYYEGQAEDWGKVLNFIHDEDLICMKTKEWTPLERGAVEHKFYCSDGTYGELSMIKELKGKTVIVELKDTDITSPGMPEAPVSPIPDCSQYPLETE